MKTLRKCFVLAAMVAGALLLSARDASACWGRWYRGGCCYQTYSYPACYGSNFQPGYTYQPYYTYTYQPYYANAYNCQPRYTYPTWSFGHRWGWRLWR
jgi:hypothetical protein